MTIFEFSDYKSYVRDRIASMPRKGRGELQKISKELRMHPTRVSHIFRGDLHLTSEQAAELCRYLGLSQIESEYFMTLLQLAKAGSKELKRMLHQQIQSMQDRSRQLVNRMPRDRVLTNDEKATFYSSWIYSAARMLSSLEGVNSLDGMAEYLNLPRERVREIMDFLISTGLCVEEGGQFRMGHKMTHLEATSPFVRQHHANWRLKALSRHERITDRELAYTAPVSIAKKDQAKLRELLVQTIQDFLKTVKDSEPPEMVACLTIDWFEF